jgi:O-antigen ligase
MLMPLALTISFMCARAERPGPIPRDGTLRMWLFHSAATTMAISLVQTRSRAGILGLGLTVVAMGALLMRRLPGRRTRLLPAAGLALLLIAGVAATGVRPLVGRFAADSWSTAHGRLPIWRQALAIARDFPVTGSGFNTWQRIVPLYPTPEIDEPYEGAHNDYLQLAAEGGLLVGLPALSTLGFFIWEARKRLRESSGDITTEWLRVGAVAGLALLAIQATVDFSLQIPGTAAMAAVLAAIAVHRATPHAA